MLSGGLTVFGFRFSVFGSSGTLENTSTAVMACPPKPWRRKKARSPGLDFAPRESAGLTFHQFNRKLKAENRKLKTAAP
jgi:hypothetical protein